YAYEFDAVGNWVKMTTSVAVLEGGKVSFEPSEVTYRTISYYLDQTVLAKMSQPAAAPATQSPAAVNNAPSNAAPSASAANAQPQPVSKPQAPAANASAAQPKPSTTAPPSTTATAKAAPARNGAAPMLVASLDKTAVSAPSVAAASSTSVPLAEGPAVKSEGDAPAPAPAAPVRTGPLKPVSAGVLNGKAISLPAPAYPEMARRAGATGLVQVEVVIDINGKVISAKAVSGPAFLRQTAEMAARLARFSPTLLSGQPVRVSGVINYNFTN
ncbi:MAG TPA: energy transducer TonB, partial [Pyrinomonadaceae bacterium]